MIRQDYSPHDQNTVIKKFRRSGPLDAYIYQDGNNEKNVQETNEHSPALVSEERKLTHLFTDGACTQNGKRGAKAAWAFLCVNDTTRVIEHRDSGKIPFSEQQTNQRAELRALSNALMYAKEIGGNICIWSDSQYAIQCASVWGPSWKRKGWVKQGGEIQHLDIIKPLVETTLAMGQMLEYKWVKAHKGGDAMHQFPWMFNHAVDQLASAALT
jgi:ribonuclease HI